MKDTSMKIINTGTADQRGAKMLIVGPTGVGKTSLLRTVDLSSVLFVDIEAGDLAVQDLAIDTLRPRTWPECRDLAVALAGANPAVPADACYSAAHYTAVRDRFGDPELLNSYETFFVDSITAAGRLCFAWSSQQPEAFSDRSGKKDLRGAYGLHAREMLAWLMHLQQAKSLAELSRQEMTAFLADALSLIRKAMAARDRGRDLVTRRTPASTAREALAAAGGVLMEPDELNDSLDGI
jgi:hypothetical protein